MDNADRHTLDALDAFLDRTFQGRAADSSALDPGLTECARRLYARDDAPAADPIFLRNLREDLMLTPTPALTGTTHAYPPSIVASPRIARPRLLPPTGKTAVRTLNHWRRRAWPAVEFLTAAVLLMGLLAGAFSLNNGPASFVQDEVSGVAMLGGNPARTGEMPGPGPEGQPGLVWKAQVGINGDLSPGSAPIVVDGMVYLVASGPTFYVNQFFLVAMDASTGLNLWQVRLDGTSYAAPAVANGLVYVGVTTDEVVRGEILGTPPPPQAESGAMVAFDAATGAEKWRQETRGSGSSSPAIGDGMVVIGSTDGGMYAFDAENGEPRWQSDAARVEFDPGNPPLLQSASSPAVDDTSVFVSSTQGTVHSLDIDSGEERWQVAVADGVLGMPVVSGDTLLIRGLADKYGIASADDTKLTAIEIATGEVTWTFDSSPEDFLSVSTSGNLIFVVESNRQMSRIQALDRLTGEEQWTTEYAAQTREFPMTADGRLYVGDQDGYIRALEMETGREEWTVRLGGSVTQSLAVVNGRVYAVSDIEGNVYALGATSARDGTPGATPPVDGDVSGFAPCLVEPRPEPEFVLQRVGGEIATIPGTPSATPEASVVAVTDLQRRGRIAGMLPADVPTGPAASDSQVDEIKATLAEMANCNRPGNEGQIAAFYSDDFFNRPWVAVSAEQNGYQILWAPEDRALPSIESTAVLEAGRVAVLIGYNGFFSRLVVFAERDGRWLIDELVEVTQQPEMG